MTIEITLLGTGSPIPDPNRAGPSTLIRAGGQQLLVDCGRGVLQRLAAAGCSASTLSALLLTHLHSDHIADLGDLLITRWVTTFTPDAPPLPIIGPPGTAIRAFREAAAAGDKDKAGVLLVSTSRKLDKAASKGVIHKNQAANKKSALAKALNQL